MLLLGKYGISEARVLAMTQAEVTGWVDALVALNRGARQPSGRHAETRTTLIQSLRRKPPKG